MEVMNITVEPGWTKWGVQPKPEIKANQLLPGKELIDYI